MQPRAFPLRRVPKVPPGSLFGVVYSLGHVFGCEPDEGQQIRRVRSRHLLGRENVLIRPGEEGRFSGFSARRVLAGRKTRQLAVFRLGVEPLQELDRDLALPRSQS